jgi:RNase P/RNase MRP subunit p29
LYTESVRIRISDPITGNPLPCALTLQGTELYATIKGTDLDTELTDGEMVDYELTGNSGDKSDYRFNLTVVPVDEDEDKDTALLITAIDTHDGTLDVEIPIAFGPANLSLDNRELYVGYSNRVVFTLRNYRGEVMPGRDIYQGTMPIGTTDENGELLYNVIPSASGKVLFKAATDAVRNRFDQYVLAEAGTKQDLTGPVLKVVLPESTSDEILVVTGSVTDETRVASVYVNNIPVAIIPGKTSVFTCQVPLREGPNQISIIALDAAGNGTPFSAVVLRTPPPLPPSVSVVIGAVDPGAGLDVPAYLEPGRTMVPLRFISESQGGEVVWDQPTMAATIRINGRSACVVVGSRTAVIDGMPASLLAAPTLKNGRVFVGLADMARLVGGTTAWDEGTKTATIILP